MSDITTDMRAWGSAGTIWSTDYAFDDQNAPDYRYMNKFVHETSRLVRKYKDTLNGRLESRSGTTYPSSPEEGHLSWRTDKSPSRLSIYDGGASTWRELTYKSEFDGHRSSSNPHGTSLEDARSQDNTITGDMVVDTGNNIVLADGSNAASEQWVNNNAPPAVSVSNNDTVVLSKATDIDARGNLSFTDQGDGTVTLDDAHNHDSRYYTQSQVDDIAADSNSEPSYVEVRTSAPSSPAAGREWVIQ